MKEHQFVLQTVKQRRDFPNQSALEQGGEEFQTAQMAQRSHRRGVTHDDGQGSHPKTVQSCQLLCQVLDGRTVNRDLPFQQRVFHAVAVQAS